MDPTNLEEPSMVVDATMMDPTMEDLFGDAANDLNVGMPSTPLPASLILRIAEMQGNGCCQKLAWGNTGSIACISADGSKVSFYVLVRDMTKKMWTISAESTFPIKAPQGRTFVHVQFGALGVEMALVDSAGMVHMRTLAGALGRMVPAERDPSREKQPRNEFDAVVGMHWLCLWPNQFTGPYIHPAHKINDRWEAQLQPREQSSIKAHHPAHGRHAMLYITRSTELTLQYQNEGQGWMSTSIFLESVRSSDELVSHAALGEEGADLLAVTYDHSSRLRLYRVTIEWNAVQQSRGQGHYTLVNPTLAVHHLTAAHNARAQHADGAKLVHLRLIPAIPEAATSQPSLPTVIAVFTQTAFSMGDTAQTQGSFSIIAHWRVESSMPTLHPSFKKLNGRDSNAVLNPIWKLQRNPDIMTNKVILSVRSQMFDTIMAFSASDGTVDMRDRLTMDSISPFGDNKTASSLSSSGFEHLAVAHNNHVTTSADGSAVVMVRTDKTIAASPMTFTHGWAVEEDDVVDAKTYIEAAAVCIARQYAFLCYSSISNDEPLALLPIESPLELRAMVVKTIFKIMNKSPDISMHEVSKQQIIIIRESLVPRVLSVQLSLGTNHATGARNFSAEYAYAVLNLRHHTTALFQTVASKDMRTISPEAVHSLIPLVKWSISLIIHIIATLVETRRNAPDGQEPWESFSLLVEKTGSPAFHLLLSSFSRALLRFQVSFLNKFMQVATQIAPSAPSVSARQDLQGIATEATKLPLPLPKIEVLLAELDAAVRNTYSTSNLSVDRRSEIEVDMLVDGTVPAELHPALEVFFEKLLPKFTTDPSVDIVELYFWDAKDLQLGGRVKGEKRMDVIRKVELKEKRGEGTGKGIRWCRRCGCEMEDFSFERTRELPVWLGYAMKTCVCMNFWVVG